jgi:hypothetical protein
VVIVLGFVIRFTVSDYAFAIHIQFVILYNTKLYRHIIYMYIVNNKK